MEVSMASPITQLITPGTPEARKNTAQFVVGLAIACPAVSEEATLRAHSAIALFAMGQIDPLLSQLAADARQKHPGRSDEETRWAIAPFITERLNGISSGLAWMYAILSDLFWGTS